MNPVVRPIINRIRIRLNKWFGGALEYIATSGKSDSFQGPVIFIIGPPRSGSTLVMQVLTDAYKFAYLSNVHCRWFGAPGIVEKLFKISDHKERSEYESWHGKTSLPSDPAECGAWWYRFFRRNPPYVTSSDVRDSSMRALRRSLQLLSGESGKTPIFKNLYASLRLEPIAVHVPNALFIVVERDLVDNAQSILGGRYDALGDYNRWWSVSPPDVEELSKMPPVDQVVGQILSIHDLINHDISRLGLKGRTFRICYEDFCNDVHGTLEAFYDFVCANGLEIGYRYNVPEQFSITHSRKVPEAMYEELMGAAAYSQQEKESEEGFSE